MVYLTFDTNIWIYFMDESWTEENSLDYLEYWAEQKQITLVIPDIIIEEWERNKEKNREYRKKKLKDFFYMAEEILPSDFFKDYRKPEVIDSIINDQFTRIEKLIYSAEIITTSQEVKNWVIDRGLKEIAPLHRNKNSIADTIIILSLFEYTKTNQPGDYHFITNNKEDFFEKESGQWSLHSDLKDACETNNITVYQNIKECLFKLKKLLPVTIDLGKRRKQRIRSKIKEKIFNPVFDKIPDIETRFIENSRVIDSVVNQPNPTPETVTWILSLFEKDKSYEEYFFKKLNNPSWLKALVNLGIYDPERNPEPVKVENGFIIPPWYAISYLEKLSLAIANGKYLELTDDIIEIVRRISASPKDNYPVWYTVIRIVSNMPNDKVPKDILNFVPTWLTTTFSSSLPSSEIVRRLLPKFLTESNEDIQKGEIILSRIVEIYKHQSKGDTVWEYNTEKYYVLIDHYYLQHLAEDQDLLSKIALQCSDKTLYTIARNIKRLLLDYPKGINVSFVSGHEIYEVKVVIEESNLHFGIRKKDDESSAEFFINDYERYSEEEFSDRIIETLKEKAVPIEENENNEWNLKMLLGAFHGYSQSLNLNNINQLNKRLHTRSTEVLFAVLLRELLMKKAITHPRVVIAFVSELYNSTEFRLSFFRKLALYLISHNWQLLKHIFWNSPEFVFHDHHYEKELYEFLTTTNQLFTAEETNVLRNIISGGPNVKSENTDYWKLRWLSALKDNIHFAEEYQSISKVVGKTNIHYEELGQLRWRRGSISPYSVEELQAMGHQQIVDLLKHFKPKDKWENPSISGLAETLGKAVTGNPVWISNSLKLYTEVYYIYAYHIINGFTEALKANKVFNSAPVFEFSKLYISTEQFDKDSLGLEEDSWNATREWIVGAIGYLVTQATDNDEHIIEKRDMPIIKDLVLLLAEQVKPDDHWRESEMNLATYSFNSTGGKVYRGLLDYALRRARSIYGEFPSDEIRWEEDIKQAVDNGLKKRVIDVYIVSGMYYQQLAYLDRKWADNFFIQAEGFDIEYWRAFFGGLCFASAPFNFEIYSALYPHYVKAININYESLEQSIVYHLVAFLLYGFDTLDKDSLLLKFVKNAKTEALTELVNYMWRQEDYVKSLEGKERARFDSSILKLWKALTQKKDTKVLESIPVWICFIEELTPTVADILLQSTKVVVTYHFWSELLENLVRLMNKGDRQVVTEQVAKILSSLQFTNHIVDYDQARIEALLNFLYGNGEKEAPNKICDQISKLGYDFVNSLYDKYNSANN